MDQEEKDLLLRIFRLAEKMERDINSLKNQLNNIEYKVNTIQSNTK